MTYPDLLAYFQPLVDEGIAPEELVGRAKDKRANFGSVLKLVTRLHGVSLGEARRMVDAHPAWRAEFENCRILTDMFFAAEDDD